ncbi:MAG: DUF1015 domain-containing protein [Pyrinomonadaceae bacterium]
MKLTVQPKHQQPTNKRFFRGDFPQVSAIKPFRALRPALAAAKQVSSVPYDVCSRAELKDLIGANPHSFLRVTRAEVDLGNEIAPDSQEIFDRARENLENLIDKKKLVLETEPSLYIYRLSTAAHAQTGVVACCSLDEYENGLIKKHEKTRPEKVEDRTRHILTLRAQTGLIFFAFRQTAKLHDLIAENAAGEPLYDFVCEQNVRHQIWKASRTNDLVKAFAEVPALYVADGHHRAEAADAARKILRAANPNHTGAEDYNYVVAGIFPDTDLKILAYNRAVKDLNGLSKAEFLEKLNKNFVVAETENPVPEKRGEFCFYLAGKWRKAIFSKADSANIEPIDALDASILQTHVLQPILGIEDVRTDGRIEFVGGIRGTRELENLVDAGRAKIAFSMFPTSLEDLFAISDAGEIMPPKSTWFEPKLRDGLLVHLI